MEKNDFSLLLVKRNLTNERFKSILKKEEKPQRYREINAHKNEISRLPKQITRFSNVVVLDCTSCNFTSMNAFSHLVKLKELWLYDNDIEAVPKSISNMVNLRELDLSRNKIGFVAWDCLPQRLELLMLGDNEIREVDPSVEKLAKLSQFSLEHNELPPHLMKRTNGLSATGKYIESIANYFGKIKRCRSAALSLVWIRWRFPKNSGLLGEIPKEIVKCIAQMVYSSKFDVCWE